jgi:hypothetical protein
MKMPFRLRRMAAHGVITGLFVPGEDAGGLLALCGRLSGVFPPVYAVPGGFLIRLPAGLPSQTPESPGVAVPGALLLRSLVDHLFLPADAELEPHLLPDEAIGLTRRQGLVFLPGPRVLGFDPAHPLHPGELVQPPLLLPSPALGEGLGVRGERHWQPLPQRPVLPDRLREVILDRPLETPESIISSGGEAIGTETPRPPQAGMGAQMAGQAAAGAGKGLLWLGNALGWKALASLGARLIDEAVRRVPRVSEAILGAQEAALRELLRQFREGNLEDALRRALPLGSAPSRGSLAAQDARLPWHNLLYSLGELLGGSQRPASVWLGGMNVRSELESEYRKAAEAATRRGDYRRAAFIYGKLLQDYRLAADVLARGGLHHDAAVLYLDKLGDPLSAARCFEAGGEIDRALHLYRQRNEHALAGDLLRRAGELEGAVEEYRLAADRLVAENNHLAAGELFLQRVNRADLALDYFAAGWAGRPHGSSLACLHRLLALHAEQAASAELLRLVDEADELFSRSALAGPALDHQASQFYNALAGLARRDNLTDCREDLHDRALLGLAARLRQRAGFEDRPGGTVSSLFGAAPHWSPSLVRDADHAYRTAVRQRPARTNTAAVTRMKTLRGRVTAVCAASTTGDLFLGFETGALVGFQPRPGIQHPFPAYPWPIASVSTDPSGEHLLILRVGEEVLHLSSAQRSGGSYQMGKWRTLEHQQEQPRPPLVTPLAVLDGIVCGWMWAGRFLVRLWGSDFLPNGRVDLPFPPDEFQAGVILPSTEEVSDRTLPVLVGGGALWLPAGQLLRPGRRVYSSPSRPAGAGLIHPVLSWLIPSRSHLELAGLRSEGGIFWCQSNPSTARLKFQEQSIASADFRATALLGPARLAGVTATGVQWLQVGGTAGVQVTGQTPAHLEDAIACFASPLTGELLVVCAEGDVVRVAIPA